ncbi:MAG: SDR family oxidoreductase [Firmicutes bacterium]|nr:SDR family oxidoreductase [Bacillota bacterium]
MRLQGQAAIVTGATSGIGKAIALLFAQEGARVVVVGRNQERGRETLLEIESRGGQAIFLPTELTDEEQVRKMAADAVDSFGQIDILVNNAGVVFNGSIPETDLANWNHVYHVNVTSAYLASRFVLPHMLARKSGVILNVSSEAGLKGLRSRAAYCTAKAALIGLTKAMAADHSPDGIRVNVICPGTVETPMVAGVIASHPRPEEMRKEFISRRMTPFLGTPEEIAHAALYLASPEARYVTGAVLAVDGGSSAK